MFLGLFFFKDNFRREIELLFRIIDSLIFRDNVFWFEYDELLVDFVGIKV